MKGSSFPLRLLLILGLLLPNFEVACTTAITAGAITAGAITAGTMTAAFTFEFLGYSQPVAAQSSSSGGYSRPGGSSSGDAGRRPSTSGGGGGYNRPYGAGTSAFSGGDRSMSRSYSGQALRGYQQQQQQTGAGTYGGSPWERRSPTYGGDNGYLAPTRRPPAQNPTVMGGGFGGPTPSFGGQSRFGALDAVLLLSLLNSLNAPGRTQFFRDNRDNPDYQAWRREADRMAQQDPALAGKLAELDRRVAGQTADSGAPNETSRRPSAAAAVKPNGSGLVMPVIVLGVGSIAGLWFLRRRSGASVASPVAPGLSGSAQSRFRVGMTFPMDPSPFLLAAGATKVRPPQGGDMVSVEAVGLVADRSVALHRLYLPGRDAFLQLHLAGSGEPDECRYFSKIDEVTPSSQDEWGFWLDPAQGMIGWPQFQTKDGKTYDRVWGPGSSRIQPYQQTETIQDLQGTRQRKLLSMLYGARTGASPPAPDTEYVLVVAVDDGATAWIEIHAGIDINPATLNLPSIPLSA